MKRRLIQRVCVATVIALASSHASAFSWAAVLAWFQTTQRELSAIAIQTKQNAVSANQISDAEVNSRKTLAVAMGALMTSERVREVVKNYDPMLGQPMLLKCDAQMERAMQVAVFDQAAKNTRGFINAYASAGTPSRAAANKDSLVQHRELFCTVSEAKQGLCELKPNGMQGWDASYAGPYGEDRVTPDVELAAYSYVAHLADTRPAKGINCKSEACAVAKLKHMEQSAIGSMVSTSLIGQLSERRSTFLE